MLRVNAANIDNVLNSSSDS